MFVSVLTFTDLLWDVWGFLVVACGTEIKVLSSLYFSFPGS